MGVELPPQTREQVQPPTREQVWKLIDKAAELGKDGATARIGRNIVFLAAFTGLRRGEILALTYADVDWFAGELVVSSAVKRVRANDRVHKYLCKIGQPKHHKIRRVGVGAKVLQLLAELKQAAADPQGLIFTPQMAGIAGRTCPFIDPDYFDTSIYAPIAVAAELPSVRFHDLRHFFASMLIAQGESAKYVCDQMGHSSIQVTFDIYGHLFPQARREASAKLEDAMFAGRKNLMVESLVEKPPKPAERMSAAKTTN